MIKSITIINNLGNSIKIKLDERDPEHGMIIKNIDGLGPPKANINTTNIVALDGTIYNSAKMENRNLLLYMVFELSPTIEDTRLKTYKYFPIKKQVTLQIETDNRFVETTGFVESNEPDIFSKEESNQISIICPDPYFYSLKEEQETIFYGIEPKFEFEFSNESLNSSLLTFGEINIEDIKEIYYDGDGEPGVIITIHILEATGDITIRNLETDEEMVIKINKIRIGVAPGDDIIITSERSNKSVKILRNGEYINILNSLSRDSSWFKLKKGSNYFICSAEYGFENILFFVKNKIMYEGV